MTPRLTLTRARTSKVQDMLDYLIDARPAAAARKIKALPREELEACLFAAATGVSRKYRVPAGLPEAPKARADEITERTRRAVRDILRDNPASIVGVLLGAGDAVDLFDPRHHDDQAEAA